MIKEKAKEKIKQLVANYEILSPTRLKEYNESDTRKNYILPLFSALGWETSTDEVREEFNVSKGNVDYSFMIGNASAFFLEAKKLTVNLDKWKEKAVNYGWNKGVTWVVLTNFRELLIFNTESKERRRFLEFQHNEYLKRFDELWLLSKKGFENNLLNREAERIGIGLKRERVSERLAGDLTYWRKELSKYFKIYSPKVSQEKIDEAVQVILNRLVFIRACEDRKTESPVLLPALRKWESKQDYRIDFIKDLNKIFRQFDKWYDSKLFAKHFGEKLKTETLPLISIIKGLYKTDGDRYDFSAIDADILGCIYEQYLGTVQERLKKKVKKDAVRKEHGIYYTPGFIVNYIIQNVLNRFIQQKSEKEIKSMKILDPACGSGSFLIKSFDELEKLFVKRRSQKEKKNYSSIKRTILKENIYGVDLDGKAVEISMLNLLLKALETRARLPMLSDNIKEGNSLISGIEKTLKEYYGERWREKKPFSWEDEFKEIMDGGGFDIIIGNPPWGATIDDDIRYFKDEYPDSTKGHKDIFKIFIDKALRLLKKGGILGFIVPNTCLFQAKYKDVRLLLNKYKLLYIVNLGERVFSGVEAPSCIIICEKSIRGKNKFKFLDLSYSKSNDYKQKQLISPKYVEVDQSIYDNTVDNAFISFYRKLGEQEVILDKVLNCRDAGVQYAAPGAGKVGKGKAKLGTRLFYKGKKKENENDIKLLIGKDINRWWVNPVCINYLKHNYRKIIHKGEWIHFTEYIFNASPRIVWRQTADHVIAAVDTSKKWFKKSVHAGVLRKDYEEKVDLKYVLSLLNSKYLNYIYTELTKESGRVFAQVKLSKIKELPIKLISRAEQQPFIELVDKLMGLRKRLNDIKKSPLEDQDPEYEKTKKEIKKKVKILNQKVYKLYGLKEKEIKDIEKRFKD